MSKWDIKDINNWSWKKHPLGAIIPEAGTAANYKTGGWRALRPIRDEEKCNHCLICFILCPDTSIIVEDEKVTGFNLQHCKGCGICAYECPRDAIEIVDEAEAASQENQERGNA